MKQLNTIRFIRTSLNEDQHQFAARIGVSVCTISRYERGTHRPSAKFIQALYNKLSLTDVQLMRIHYVNEYQKEIVSDIRKNVGLSE